MHELSFGSLLIQPKYNEVKLASATGFVTQFQGKYYLVSNFHVFSGRNYKTLRCLDQKKLAIPNNISVVLPITNKDVVIEFRCVNFELYDEKGNPKWLKHPTEKVDVGVLPMNLGEIGINYVPLYLGEADVIVDPGTVVSIIGFPYGKTYSNLPFWVSGFIASETNIKSESIIYVNAPGRKGMSGSPVFFKTRLGYFTRNLSYIAGAEVLKFMGVYSGRLGKGTDLCLVWKPEIIEQILNQK